MQSLSLAEPCPLNKMLIHTDLQGKVKMLSFDMSALVLLNYRLSF